MLWYIGIVACSLWFHEINRVLLFVDRSSHGNYLVYSHMSVIFLRYSNRLIARIVKNSYIIALQLVSGFQTYKNHLSSN